MRGSQHGIAERAGCVLLACAVLAGGAEAARAVDAADLERVRTRLERAEQLLDATREGIAAAERRLDAQGRVVDRLPPGERGASSGLFAFLDTVHVSGLVAASYTHNANDPSDSAVHARNPYRTTGGENYGVFKITAPLHTNASSFQVDQAWLSVERRATPASPVGFGLDLSWGASADWLGEPQQPGRDDLATGDLPHVFQAYAAWLAPIGDGVLVEAGRFRGLLGSEFQRADMNFNVTRGLLWTLQPVNHTGVVFSGLLGDRWDWALAIANAYSNTMGDTDNSKTAIARLGWTGEAWRFGLSGLVGGDTPDPIASHLGGPPGVGRDSDFLVVLDLTADWDPSPNLSMWLDFDWFYPRGDHLPHRHVYGVSIASRLVVAAFTGFSLRGEYIRGEDVLQGIDRVDGSGDVTFASVTATFDRELAEGLTLKLEGRYDWVDIEGAADDAFVTDDDIETGRGPLLFDRDDQLLALIQLLYSF